MSNCSASGKYDKAKNRPKALQFTEEEEELERTSKQRHRKVQAKQTSADTMSKKQKQQPQAPAALPKLPKLVAKHGIELRGLYPEDAPTIYALHNALSASEYKEGQGFGPHYDEEDACPATARASCYTLLLYLNDVAAGGETVFYRSRGREVAAVTPEQGLVVVHAQGPDCLLHEGRPAQAEQDAAVSSLASGPQEGRRGAAGRLVKVCTLQP
eukprot:XP_001689846.1 predicted protein [Chlamydomonas reinhardtii]